MKQRERQLHREKDREQERIKNEAERECSEWNKQNEGDG